MENISNEDFKNVLYVSSSEKINSYTGNKDFFIGNGTIANPDGIHKLDLDRQNSLWRNGILAIEFQVELQALESKEISIVLGAEESIINCQDNAYKYGKISNVKEEYEKSKRVLGRYNRQGSRKNTGRVYEYIVKWMAYISNNISKIIGAKRLLSIRWCFWI